MCVTRRTVACLDLLKAVGVDLGLVFTVEPEDAARELGDTDLLGYHLEAGVL